MKFKIWIHQRFLDKMTRLQWLCQDVGMLNRFSQPLQEYNFRLLQAQLARRAKAGIPVIQCSVTWGVE